VHLDEMYAAKSRFGRRIAHGMLAVSYISAVLGTVFPGPGTIYLSQNVSFLKPVFLGDTVTATVTVSKFRAEKGILTLVTECWNQHGEKVVDGQAVCLVTDVVEEAALVAEQVSEQSRS
jgi:3-hydroxybutyryl-CoA dehydratase